MTDLVVLWFSCCLAVDFDVVLVGLITLVLLLGCFGLVGIGVVCWF